MSCGKCEHCDCSKSPEAQAVDKFNESMQSDLGAVNPCACVGPQDGEPVCPCAMRWVTVVGGRYYRVNTDQNHRGVSATYIGDVDALALAAAEETRRVREAEFKIAIAKFVESMNADKNK